MNQTNFSKNTQKACQAIITLFLVITLNSYNQITISEHITNIDYDPKSEKTIEFFKIIQNKLL